MMNPAELVWLRARALCPDGVSCVELASLPDGGVAVRDSKEAPQGAVLQFTKTEWDAFAHGMATGEFASLGG